MLRLLLPPLGLALRDRQEVPRDQGEAEKGEGGAEEVVEAEEGGAARAVSTRRKADAGQQDARDFRRSLCFGEREDSMLRYAEETRLAFQGGGRGRNKLSCALARHCCMSSSIPAVADPFLYPSRARLCAITV
jgi:hypothetical protein